MGGGRGAEGGGREEGEGLTGFLAVRAPKTDLVLKVVIFTYIV